MAVRKNFHFVVSDSISSRVSRTLRKAASAKFSGFTLVELIVVITILAILATVGFLGLSGYTHDARDAKAKANIRSVYSAISTESVLTGNSPRHYVAHDADYALSGAYLYVDGTPVALTGGNVGEAPTDSNYTAGTPRWNRLKLDPEKFRTSGISGDSRFARDFRPFFPKVIADFDKTELSAWAADVQMLSATQRMRTVSFFQTAGILPDAGTVAVFGNFPMPSAADISTSELNGMPAASGLVRDSDAGPTDALKNSSSISGGTDGTTANSCSPILPPCNGNSCNLTHSATSVNQAWTKDSSSCGFVCTGGHSGEDCLTEPVSPFIPGEVYSVGQTFSLSLPSWTLANVTVQGTGIGTVAGTKSLHAPACDTDDIAIWGTSWSPQIWAACNVGATNAMPHANMRFDGVSSDVGVSTAQYSGGVFQWWNNADVRTATPWSTAENTNDDAWGNTTNTNAARRGPCAEGYHVPNGGIDATGLAYTATDNEWNAAYVIAASAGGGTSCDPATVTNQYHRLRCLLQLPRSWRRDFSTGSWNNQGARGFYWSSSPYSFNAYLADFYGTGGDVATNNGRTFGFSVRCVKH